MHEHNCDHCCDNCHECGENCCPVCGTKGLNVPFETVHNLVIPALKNINNDNEYYLCTNRACLVAYYTCDRSIQVNQVVVPILFKHEKEEFFVCYCRRITLDEIAFAVKNIEGEKTKETILRYLNKADVITDCLHNNPTGVSCDKLFDNAINYCINKM